MLCFVNVGVLTTSTVLSKYHSVVTGTAQQQGDRNHFTVKPNNLLFTASETQAGHWMSDGDAWVLINSAAGEETDGPKENRPRELERSL